MDYSNKSFVKICDNTDLNSIKKIKFDGKILFVGFGGVAKCVLHYLDYYITCDYSKIHIVDKCDESIYGPDIKKLKKSNMINNFRVTSYNFENLLNKFGMGKGDLVIDLSWHSSTYFFVSYCLSNGIHYVNTSIEDDADNFKGTSIDLQQKIVNKIFNEYKQNGKIKSNVLLEFGQNPGLYQHYILYALNQMNKLNKKQKNVKDDFSKETLTKVIDDYQIGTIFCSEIDNMIKYNEPVLKENKIYNTWSVYGFLNESFDNAELSVGSKNNYVKPFIPEKYIDRTRMKFLTKTEKQGYDVLFLKSIGIKSTFNSICPVIRNDDKIEFKNYRGKIIHHGETFEMANYFGEKSPMLSYVYKMNKYARKSIKTIFEKNPTYNGTDLQIKVESQCDNFEIFDNIGKKKEDSIIGHDTVGCTIYCGKDEVDRIFWCGSILSQDDENVHSDFTATIVQVAAAVLTGISYVLENKPSGLLFPSDLDTNYVFDKSAPLLGKLFFTEIPKDEFDGKFKFCASI